MAQRVFDVLAQGQDLSQKRLCLGLAEIGDERGENGLFLGDERGVEAGQRGTTLGQPKGETPLKKARALAGEGSADLSLKPGLGEVFGRQGVSGRDGG